MHNESITPALTAVRDARNTLAAASFPLVTGSADAARKEARTAVTQLDDYILPKLATLDAPLTVVVGGSTGAGKSTLVNTLMGEPVTRSSTIQPPPASPSCCTAPRTPMPSPPSESCPIWCGYR